MAAFLRSGARKLDLSALVHRTPAAGALVQPTPAAGALLQRTQASGAVDLRPLFLPRFMTTASEEHARARPETLSKPMDDIQEKKEELYDLIAMTENNVHTNSENRSLLRSLSAHVKPRPDDSQWRWMHAAKRRHDVLKPAGIASGFFTSVVCWLMLSEMDDFRAREAAQKEKQQVDAARAKEVPLV